MDLNIFFYELDSTFKKGDIKEAETLCLKWMDDAQKETNLPAVLAIANELGGIYRVTSRFEAGKNAYRHSNYQAVKDGKYGTAWDYAFKFS